MKIAFVLAAVLFSAASASPRPSISPDDVRQLLSMSGVNVGTTRRLGDGHLYRVDGIQVTQDGRWIVIRVLPTLVQ